MCKPDFSFLFRVAVCIHFRMLLTHLAGKFIFDTTGAFIIIHSVIHNGTKLLVVRCGASYTIEIVSDQFEGKRLLERHRMVNAALVEEMKHIHALSITKALTPDQWKQQETKNSQAAA